MSQIDYRARLTAKGGAAGIPALLGPNTANNILSPLFATSGVLFPYTPSVSTGSEAIYEPYTFTHSIYGYNAYVRSQPQSLKIDAEFTAQTIPEAYYLLAVLHFFRVVTKSYFGAQTYQESGTPPPVLLFNYLGSSLFNNVPVIIQKFSYNLDATVDYVPVNTQAFTIANITGVSPAGVTKNPGWTYVPTHITVSIEMDTQYTPVALRDTFNLNTFRTGQSLDQGWI